MLLRAAAATAAWLLVPIVPICGYVVSLWLYAPSRNNSRSPSKQAMMYSSRAALPSEWDKRQWGRQQAAQQYLKVDGLTVKYIGPGETDAQAASIFADHAVPLDIPLYYFEVTILSRGDHGYIGVGFCTDDVNLGRLPGWEPHSYGYHGDDGHAFHGSGQGRSFGPGFSTGDVIGALLDRSMRTISYYKNGVSVGTAFYDVKETHLYPCVGMRTANEEIRANFGQSPFTVDLQALQQQFKDRVLSSIAAISLPTAVDGLIPAAAAAAASSKGNCADNARSSSQQTTTTAAAAAAENAEQQHPGTNASVDQQADAFAQALLAVLSGDASDSAAAAVAAGSAAKGSTEKGKAAAVGNSSSSSSRTSQPLMPYLIFDYLLHQRCWKTAEIVAREMLGTIPAAAGTDTAAAAAAGSDDTAEPMEVSQEDNAAAAANALPEVHIQDAVRRQQIFDSVCAGQLSEALDLVHNHYGATVLDSNPRLAFKLKVQQFVELVRQASSSGSSNAQCTTGSSSSSTTTGFEAALMYGRAELGPGSKSPEDEELLSDALSLLAYADPASSPCGHLLRQQQRVLLAEELNGALLKARGTAAQPLLEIMYRQTVVLVDEMKKAGVPASLVLDVPNMCLNGTAAAAAGGPGGGKKGAGVAAAAGGGIKQD